MRTLLALWAAYVALSVAAEPIKRMQYPAISPDGSLIAFAYHGDLWTVVAEGGVATRLTVHGARDIAPVFSPDGKTIAFASDRFGNYDIYLMPTAGGEPTRLTFHSVQEGTCHRGDGARWAHRRRAQ